MAIEEPPVQEPEEEEEESEEEEDDTLSEPSDLSLEDEIFSEGCTAESAEDLKEIPQLTTLDWVATKWVVGQLVPGASGMRILRMFATATSEERTEFVPYIDGDVRIYAIPPRGELSEKEGAPDEGYRRYTINRSQPSVEGESVGRQGFIHAVRGEINELVMTNEDEVDCPKPGCDQACRPSDKFCPECGTRLPEEEPEA